MPLPMIVKEFVTENEGKMTWMLLPGPKIKI